MNPGDISVFFCGIVFAFYIVVLAERSARHDSVWLTVIQLATVVAAAGAIVPWLGPRATFASGLLPVLSRPDLIAQCIFLAAIGTTGTFLFQTWAQQHMSATHAAIIFMLEPVFTAVLAGWMLGESLGSRGWVGGALVLAGIAVSEMRLRRGPTRAAG